MGAKQRKRLRWSRVWDEGSEEKEEEDVEMEEEEKKPQVDPKGKETVWVKGGKKVDAKEMSTTRKRRGTKKVEFQEEEEEEVDELESEGSESGEEGEELKDDLEMKEKIA